MAWRVSARIIVASFMLSGCGRYGYDLLAGHSGVQEPQDGGPDGEAPGGGSVPQDGSQEPGDGTPGLGDGDGDGSPGDASVPDAAVVLPSACPAPVEPNAPAPRHRYAFERTDTLAEDSASGRSGSTTNGVQGQGRVELSGNDSFVQFPSGLVSVLDAVTIMLWVRWDGGAEAQTIFDFGQSAQNRLTLRASPSNGLEFELAQGGSNFQFVTSSSLAVGEVEFLAVEIDPARNLILLYRNGLPLLSAARTVDLRALRDDNMWLGRSNGGNAAFDGGYEEVRIYDRALGRCAIAAANGRGANDATFARCADPDDNCDYVDGAGGGFWKCDASHAFDDAAARCASAGMRLVAVNDAARNEALAEAANGSSLLLGLHDPDGARDYRWCDGRAVAFDAFESAARAGDDCVELSGTTWRGVSCASARPYACEP